MNRQQAKTAARVELEKRAAHRELARRDPLYLVSYMSAKDENDGLRFGFEHCRTPLADNEVPHQGHILGSQDSWRWQRYAGELIRDSRRLIVLKGRQIGVTWLYLAIDCAEAILYPGTTSLIYRQREGEAIDNVRRWWVLYNSLPAWWRDGIKVLTPDRGVEPGREGVKLQFPDGSLSRVVPMTSAAASGHGRTVRRILMDEAAHIEKLELIRKAVEPAAGRSKIGYVSTANGRSNPETGEGNEFHRLWVTGEHTGFTRLFLPYSVHPDRDLEWYRTTPDVVSLKPHQRQEQYPANEHEAFALTNRVWFDPEDLEHYRALVKEPEYEMGFHVKRKGAATVDRTRGPWKIWKDPVAEHKYAIGADVASGRGSDYSTAFVIDLGSMEICAQFRAKIDADLFALNLHYMGRRYNTALLAVETAGGWGEAVLIPLRDGRDGRPAYPKLYRHVLSSRPDQPLQKPYGFPTNMKTRPQILSLVDKSIRDRSLPYVTGDLLFEMESFVEWEHGTSPRAQEGANDDLVMAFAIALEMYRQKGHHPDRWQRPRKRRWRELVPLN